MDEELKEALEYVGGAFVIGATIIGLMLSITSNLWYVTFSVLFVIIFVWLAYLTLKMKSKKRGKKNEKK